MMEHCPKESQPKGRFVMKPTSRRVFLRQAAVLSAGGALAGCATTTAASKPSVPSPRTIPERRALGKEDVIRCGVAGVGNRGSALLHAALRQQDVAVVAVTDTYDVWRDRAAAWCKEKRPEVAAYVRFEEMFEKETLDAVIIATPDHIHVPAIFAALDRGLDVYTEKPMALRYEQAKAVRDRVRETGAVLQVGTQLRSMAMYQKAREVAASGVLGKLLMTQVERHSKGRPLGETATPAEATEANTHWNLFVRDTKHYPYDPHRYFNWRFYREYSNGFFGDLLLHHLDMCHFITGCGMPERVAAVGGVYCFDDGRTCPDTVSALLEYPGKFHFNYQTTWGNGHYGLCERYLFTEGSLEIGDMAALAIFRGDIKEKIASEGIRDDPHLQNFFGCMRTRETPIAPVEAGLMAAACADMAWQSMESGDTMHWNPGAEAVIAGSPAKHPRKNFRT